MTARHFDNGTDGPVAVATADSVDVAAPEVSEGRRGADLCETQL